jgi:hypothetical protein
LTAAAPDSAATPPPGSLEKEPPTSMGVTDAQIGARSARASARRGVPRPRAARTRAPTMSGSATSRHLVAAAGVALAGAVGVTPAAGGVAPPGVTATATGVGHGLPARRRAALLRAAHDRDRDRGHRRDCRLRSPSSRHRQESNARSPTHMTPRSFLAALRARRRRRRSWRAALRILSLVNR